MLDEAVRSFFEAAGSRLAWALWGKARADSTSASPAHPLVCHMIDVACVAELLLAEALPQGTVHRLTSAIVVPRGDADRWLAFLVALHDLGKASPAFQLKWPAAREPLAALGFDLAPPRTARDHGTLGVSLTQRALLEFGIDRTTAWALARAVSAHHGSFPTDADADDRRTPRSELGASAVWNAARNEIVRMLATVLAVDTRDARPLRMACERDWAFFSTLAGLTSVADWIGSMAEVFVYERPPESLESYLVRSRERARRALDHVGFRSVTRPAPHTFPELFGFAPRPLQAAVCQLVDDTPAPFCAVVEAPMGEGKTEAALYVAHALASSGIHDGVFLALPTQATANQMFDRLSAFLRHTRPHEQINLQLIHAEAVFDARVRALIHAVYANRDDHLGREASSLVCERWFLGKKRALLAPFGAGTADQALLAVLRTRHAFVRQLGLAGKTIVLDEVHAYDTYTSTLLDELVAWLGALGATVVILSATLPAERRCALLRAYTGSQTAPQEHSAYPRISWASPATSGVRTIATGRHPVPVRIEWLEDDDDALLRRIIAQLGDGGCIGVIRNTVSRAQVLFRELRSACGDGRAPADTQLLLLHSRFPVEDRAHLERTLIERLRRDGQRPPRLVAVGTQVLEQSLDVDFDLLFTDLAPIDLVLQRTGRLHRHEGRPRPRGTEPATLGIVAPSGDAFSVPLGRVAPVYEPYIVRRSLGVLRSRLSLSLPDDIELLVERVYSKPAPGDTEGFVREELEAFDNRRSSEAALAIERVWHSPHSVDDPLGSLRMPFEEDNPEVSRMLRAETRLGPDSVELVCLFGSATHTFLDRACTVRIDLTNELHREDVRRLAQRTVRIATPGLVQRIRELPLPSTWAELSLLSRRRPLFFGSVPIHIGDFHLDLDPELGLVVSHPKENLHAIPTND